MGSFWCFPFVLLRTWYHFWTAKAKNYFEVKATKTQTAQASENRGHGGNRSYERLVD